MLSDRKKKILKIVIDDYINKPTPISSKYLQEAHLPSLSSATIRNELASLEELGFLIQPHTSSGRIPTKNAYKMYIESFLEETHLSYKEVKQIYEHFDDKLTQVEYVVKSAAKVLSELTNYTSLASMPKIFSEKIANIRLVKLSKFSTIMIVVTESGKIKDFVLKEEFDDSNDNFLTAEKVLNKTLIGKNLVELENIEVKLVEEFFEFKRIFLQALKFLKEYLKADLHTNLYVEGESKIFEQPEFNNIENVKGFIALLDSREHLSQILNSQDGNLKVNVTIGGEGDALDKDCAVVSCNYQINGVDFGTFGVIGPVRMDYNKVITVLNGIGEILTDLLQEK